MIPITLTFATTQAQASIQVGDTAYYIDPSSSGGFQIGDNFTQDNIITIGKVTSVDGGYLSDQDYFNITCDMINNATPPTTSSFILFSKDNTVNCSSLVGYYGSAKFKNDSTEKAEMFATSCEINESSK
jgi:hypothetical protein